MSFPAALLALLLVSGVRTAHVQGRAMAKERQTFDTAHVLERAMAKERLTFYNAQVQERITAADERQTYDNLVKQANDEYKPLISDGPLDIHKQVC